MSVLSPPRNFWSTPRPCVPDSAEKVTKLGIKPISSENFYGSPSPPKARTSLFIDTLESKKLVPVNHNRSLSKDSISSNRSFVSGSNKHKRTSSGGSHIGGHRSRRSQNKGPYIGVWHNIKKPKKINKTIKIVKPRTSPEQRLLSTSPESPESTIDVKSKRLFKEKPRRRKAYHKKRNVDDLNEDGIIDSFPHHLIKRKKLPTQSTSANEDPEESPNPNKKFMKYKHGKRATLTLSDNVKLQISDGVMKLETPKRRKLYSRRDVIVDFNEGEDANSGIEESVKNILERLQNDKEVSCVQRKQLSSPCKVQVERITDDQLLGILESPSTKVNIVEATPTKSLTEISPSGSQKIYTNLASMVLDDFETLDSEEALISTYNITPRKRLSNEMTLEKTGSVLSHAANVLCNNFQDTYPPSPISYADENTTPNDEESKMYSLFYRENWNKSRSYLGDTTNTKNSSIKKKSLLVGNDQYLLDAGQKSVGIVTCGKCGVMYQAGDFTDEATHNNFHNHLPELRFTGWTNERVVGKYSDGRIIMILSGDPKTWLQKVNKILDIVDQDLGFPEASVKTLHDKTVYFYVNDKSKQIIGCLIAEQCKTAYKMFPPLEGIEIDSCSRDPSPCKVGISRIWTALSHRRRGIATRLYDCMRRTFIFGEIVSMDHIAFSVPSPAGKLLAQKITGKVDFLVYGF